MLLDSDWIRISDQVSEEWADHLTETLALIGSTQKEGARLSGEEENPVNVEEVFKNTVKWLSATTNSIDNEDAKVVERVSNYKVIAISSESRQLQSFNTVFNTYSKWFEPRSISSSYCVIVRVSVVLKRTVVGD